MNTESNDHDNGAVQDSDSSTSSTFDQPYDGMRPWARDLLRDDGAYCDYSPIFEKSGQTKFSISLMMPQSVDATPAALTELFFSDTLLDAWVKCTNEYAASRLSPVQ
jgi:Transposase IS4